MSTLHRRLATSFSMAILAAALAMGSSPAAAAFILLFSENEIEDNGSLFVDTEAAPGSPVTDADLSDLTKTPSATVTSAPGALRSLPGYVPRLCGNETGFLGTVAVSKTCQVSLFLALGSIAAADNLKSGIAFVMEPVGQPHEGQVSDSLQITLIANNNNNQSQIDFFWRSDPSATDISNNCIARADETGARQQIKTFSLLDGNGRCVNNASFDLPQANLFTVMVQSSLDVPVPPTLTLVGLGGLVLALSPKRRGSGRRTT